MRNAATSASILFVIMMFGVQTASARGGQDQCKSIIDQDLKRLGFGSFDHPTVKKETLKENSKSFQAEADRIKHETTNPPGEAVRMDRLNEFYKRRWALNDQYHMTGPKYRFMEAGSHYDEVLYFGDPKTNDPYIEVYYSEGKIIGYGVIKNRINSVEAKTRELFFNVKCEIVRFRRDEPYTTAVNAELCMSSTQSELTKLAGKVRDSFDKCCTQDRGTLSSIENEPTCLCGNVKFDPFSRACVDVQYTSTNGATKARQEVRPGTCSDFSNFQFLRFAYDRGFNGSYTASKALNEIRELCEEYKHSFSKSGQRNSKPSEKGAAKIQ